MKLNKKFKVRLNSQVRIEELLQELYDEADKNIVEIQNEINKLSSSVQLNDEIIDGKAKYAKAINDFIANKDKAIGRKLEIAKLMTEVFKFQGNIKKAVSEGEIPDWDEIQSALVDNGNNNVTEKDNNADEYKIK